MVVRQDQAQHDKKIKYRSQSHAYFDAHCTQRSRFALRFPSGQAQFDVEYLETVLKLAKHNTGKLPSGGFGNFLMLSNVALCRSSIHALSGAIVLSSCSCVLEFCSRHPVYFVPQHRPSTYTTGRTSSPNMSCPSRAFAAFLPTTERAEASALSVTSLLKV